MSDKDTSSNIAIDVAYVNTEAYEQFTKSEQEKLKLMGTTEPRRLLMMFSRHAISGMCTNALYLVIDSLVLSQKYPFQQSAVAFSLPISVYGPTAISLLCGMGVNHGLSQCLGKRDFINARKFLMAAFQLAIVFWAIYCAIFIPCAKPVLKLLGCPEELMEYALSYTKIMIYGSICSILSQTISNALRALGQARASGESLALGILCAIIIEPCLIYCTDLANKGAAAAYVIGHAVAVLIGFSFFVMKGKRAAIVRFSLQRMFFFYPKHYAHICLYGMGSFFSNFATGLSAGITNHLITSHSKVYYETATISATLGSASSLIFLFFAACIGVDTAIMACGTFAVSAGLKRRARSIFLNGLILNTLIMLFGIGLLLCLSTVTPYIFYGGHSSVDHTYRTYMEKMNLILLPGRLLVGPLISTFAMLSAINRPILSAVLSSSRKLFYFIPIIYIIESQYSKPLPLICAYPTADICAAVTAIIVIIAMRKEFFFTKEGKTGRLNIADLEEQDSKI